jgi:hypothetical protein
MKSKNKKKTNTKINGKPKILISLACSEFEIAILVGATSLQHSRLHQYF